MSTGQKYSGKGETTTLPEQTVNFQLQTAVIAAMSESDGALIVPRTYGGSFRSPIKIQANAFVDSLGDFAYLIEVREAIRAWFCCYIPDDIHTSVPGPNLERSATLFQHLDEFVNDLMVSAFAEVSAKQ
ncbi:hypothetical protein GO755_36085 [Spirosoma sp. HMF4905]|uniref:Uncharacterized protein n=1 Tax=Spirosoma arboris TaxID=2682092 RepID=A0A7K1SNW6_9BACT|nr:hypothetical protein [Spirosoma arboris]MVM35498.1 hypothetical protein [Spirosoma arboris]